MADIGWLTLAEANTYFTTRLNTATWDAASDADKTAALTMAYKDLFYHRDYAFPATATQAMQDAQCEQGLFQLNWGDAADRRDSLLAQGVTQAGIVKESYDERETGEVPLSVRAQLLVETFRTARRSVAVGNLYRNEDQDVDGDTLGSDSNLLG